jgi:hypothetical protein
LRRVFWLLRTFSKPLRKVSDLWKSDAKARRTFSKVGEGVPNLRSAVFSPRGTSRKLSRRDFLA